MYYEGDSGLFMSNAWVDGIWPSTISPYKLARPASLRGTITQDRGAAIMGVDGYTTPAASVSATVTNTDTSKVGTSTVSIPSHVINSASWDFEGLAPMAAYIAATRACDVYWMQGSAHTTTTVVVSDGAQTHEIVYANMFDDSLDIPAEAMMDVASIVSELQYLGTNGIAHPDILSVDVVATITRERRYADVVNVDVPGGLKTGANTAVVSLLQWGVEDTQTVSVPFTVPAGAPLTGMLQASGPWGGDEDEEFFEDEFFESESDGVDGRQTVQQAVDSIRSSLPNNTLMVTYSPMDMMSELDEGDFEMPKRYNAVTATDTIDWVVYDSATKIAPRFFLQADSTTIPYGWPAYIAGELLGAENVSKIGVSRLYAGTSTPSALTTITFDPDEGPFEYLSPSLNRNAKLTFSYAGDADTLATTGSINIKVKARTSLSASRYRFKKGRTTTLRATVSPTTATGKVVFERYSGGWWWSIGTRTLSGGKAAMSYKPRRTGTYKIPCTLRSGEWLDQRREYLVKQDPEGGSVTTHAAHDAAMTCNVKARGDRPGPFACCVWPSA